MPRLLQNQADSQRPNEVAPRETGAKAARLCRTPENYWRHDPGRLQGLPRCSGWHV